MNGMQLTYPAVFDDSENHQGTYTVTFPDVPCAITEGRGMDAAVYNAKAALKLGLYGKREFPASSSLEKAQQDNPDKVVKMIEIDTDTLEEGVTDASND